ncbi:allophanate hydrolase [Halalkalibacterium halodurans]|uniref:allophanate hydrolase n=1 Tax=Halalkalibacterium halodurans TaxID=86665 RepID=UPI001068A93A|nr:allophanate hydrolase [Halalkalibacterium halodurans]TES51707.1 allophanate hydrolase [Halalkalibacterium halodurans]
MNIPYQLTAEWLREQYYRKKLTPKEVVLEIIERAKADADMNIWITPPSLELIHPYLERLNSLDIESSPLWGIPFAIKDNIDLAGVPTTAGCPEYAYQPNEDAAVVARLIAAGAIPVGKANLDQFATGLVGTRSPFGETHNSLRPELISGGSSSGSAVSVARGQAVFGLGTDTAGSGRIPALLNNLVGYKPSLGAWSTKGVVPACASLDCVTVFSHRIEDAILVDSVARGFEEEDPWSRELPVPNASLPKRFVLPKQAPEFYGPFANKYQNAWERTVAQIECLGVDVDYVDTTFLSDAAELLYGGPMVAERWASLGEFVEGHPGATFPVTEEVLRSGSASQYDAAAVFRAQHQLQAYKRQAQKLLENSVFVLPTAGGTWTRDQVRENPIGTNSEMGRYTNHCNLLDMCAVAIPAGEADVHLPFGITIFGLAEGEGLIRGAANLFLQSSTQSEEEKTLIAVCGLHMRGLPLEKQMQECRARFMREDMSAPVYQLVKLPSEPAKPGMIKKNDGSGGSIELEIWEMPLSEFGKFTKMIPAPLGIGKVELADGSEVPGFVCEAYAADGAEDITALGGWRKLLQLNESC